MDIRNEVTLSIAPVMVDEQVNSQVTSSRKGRMVQEANAQTETTVNA
jgi:hypothetical protein